MSQKFKVGDFVKVREGILDETEKLHSVIEGEIIFVRTDQFGEHYYHLKGDENDGWYKEDQLEVI